MAKRNKFGFCAGCCKMKVLTNHHIFPKRVYKHSPIFKLCRPCHDALERLIPYRKVEKHKYIEILKNFIRGDRTPTLPW